MDKSKLHIIVHSQWSTLKQFLSHSSTRTATLLIYVASFGGSLHHAVTTYFYLALGATEKDIGHLGFIMSLGALIGSPVCGWYLDRYGPWIPISVTAVACSWGCLWRGVASSLASLRISAILLGIGVNLWTVVLGHLVKSFPPTMRSEVLSGFVVQISVIQLLGKGAFPFVEFGLHSVLGVEDTLKRYRFHMGICTFFCVYGTFFLFYDRKNIKLHENSGTSSQHLNFKYKQSDIDDFLEDNNTCHANQPSSSPAGTIQQNEIELSEMSNNVIRSGSVYCATESKESLTIHQCPLTAHALFDHPNQYQLSQPLLYSTNTRNDIVYSSTTNEKYEFNSRRVFPTFVLASTLFLQSLSATIFTVIWPLLIHDRFHLSAQSFGLLTFSSSIMSTGAVASFPTVERIEWIGGTVRCAALGFVLAAILCLFFCICSFSSGWEAQVRDRLHKYEHLYESGRFLYKSDRFGWDTSFSQKKIDYQSTQQIKVSWNSLLNYSSDNSTSIDNDITTSLKEYSMINHTSLQNESMSTISVQRNNKSDIDEDMESFHSWKQVVWHAFSAIVFQASLSFLEPCLKSTLSLISVSSHTKDLGEGSSSQESFLGFTMGSMTTISNLGGMIGNIAGTWMYKYSKDLPNDISESRSSFLNGGALPFLVTGVVLMISALLIWILGNPPFKLSTQVNSVGTSSSVSWSKDSRDEERVDDSLEKVEPEVEDRCCLTLLESTENFKLE